MAHKSFSEQEEAQSLDVPSFMAVPNYQTPKVAVVVTIDQRKYTLLVEEVMGIKQMVKSSLNLPDMIHCHFKE